MPAPRRPLAPVVLAPLLALLATALVACDLVGGSDEQQRRADGPNIVLITTDDMSASDIRYLPKTRRLLGREGVRFDDFVAPQPLCCPARAQLMTGQYAHNNGVHDNNGPNGGYQAFNPTTALPVWLRDAGYRTAFVGKYLNGYGPEDWRNGAPRKEPGWDSWQPLHGGARVYVDFSVFDNGDVTRPGGYHTDVVGELSNRVVDGFAGSTPFFLWTSFAAPHGVCLEGNEDGCADPPKSLPRYRKIVRQADTSFLERPSFNEDDVSDKPHYIRKRQRVSPAVMRDLELERARSLRAVDDAVASLVDTLRRTSELDNTVLLFTSDNGFSMGQHRYVGKTLAYEESVRVPLLVRGPGFPVGERRTDEVAMIDLAPTIADLADAEPLVPVDGEVIDPEVDGAAEHEDRTLLLQAGANPANIDDVWWFRGVRTQRYTFVRYGSDVELYDRVRDPMQLRNVARDPRYKEIRRELARRTDELGACSGEDCRADYPAVPRPGY